MTEIPEIHYARSGDVALAYQVLGDGPIDLFFVPGFINNLEIAWENPPYARFLRRLASFSRLIRMDRRGTGVSDRMAPGELPPLEGSGLVFEDAGEHELKGVPDRWRLYRVVA